jgi:hypothetical protein
MFYIFFLRKKKVQGNTQIDIYLFLLNFLKEDECGLLLCFLLKHVRYIILYLFTIRVILNYNAIK